MAEHFFGLTDTGRMRDNNEDDFLAEPVLSGRFLAGCVIDGVGGYAGGEVAARIARDTIRQYLSIPSGEPLVMMREALAAANSAIWREKQERGEFPDMACVLTLALADADANTFYFAHVGDTRLYLYRDGSLVKLTHDHSFVGFLEDGGRLTEEAAMQHPKRNEINKALGFQEHVGNQADYIETGASPFLPGDLLLLCSDGLTDLVNKAEMIAILESDGSLEEKSVALVAAANEKGGKDNITVVLVRNPNRPLAQKATRPAKTVKKKSLKQQPAPAAAPADPTPMSNRKSGGLAIGLLTLLCMMLILALVWALYRDRKQEKPPVIFVREQLPQELRLQDSLDRGGDSVLRLQDTAWGSRQLLTDTLFIRRDSLHLTADSFRFVADTAFSGPALVVGPEVRYLVLENIVFQNFDMAILARGTALRLRNVRFEDCRVPVQYGLTLPAGRPVNGLITDSLFLSDSLAADLQTLRVQADSVPPKTRRR